MQLVFSALPLTAVFARNQNMLLSHEDAAAAVHRLAQAAKNLLPSAAGAGVSSIDDGGTGTSTGAAARLVEAAGVIQCDLGERPCLSAWATATFQSINDATGEDRWPVWCVATVTAGIRSVLSVPLIFPDRAPGTMKVYATVDDAFTGHEEQQLTATDADDAHAVLLTASRAQDQPMAEIARHILQRHRDPRL